MQGQQTNFGRPTTYGMNVVYPTTYNQLWNNSSIMSSNLWMFKTHQQQLDLMFKNFQREAQNVNNRKINEYLQRFGPKYGNDMPYEKNAFFRHNQYTPWSFDYNNVRTDQRDRNIVSIAIENNTKGFSEEEKKEIEYNEKQEETEEEAEEEEAEEITQQNYSPLNRRIILSRKRRRTKKVNACPHKGKPHYAKNMCSTCYHSMGREKKKRREAIALSKTEPLPQDLEVSLIKNISINKESNNEEFLSIDSTISK